MGYRWDGDKPVLVVTLSEKMAQKMRADGWDVHHETEIGHFITIQKE